jgi:thiaminase (transcriptional activator TenA)
MTTRFTQQLWHDIEPIWNAITDHPFIKGLIDGSLPEDVFRQYAVQDAIYLQAYARALAAASSKATKDEWCEMFADHARGILVDERSLHEAFFGKWGMTPDDVYSTEALPTTEAYNSYLLRIAYGAPFEEIVGAILPCYWIYWEAGKLLEAKGSPNPDFQKWIDTYSAEFFSEAAQSVIDCCDELATNLPDDRKALIRKHFITTSRYEYLFWDAAWTKETWPVNPHQ